MAGRPSESESLRLIGHHESSTPWYKKPVASFLDAADAPAIGKVNTGMNYHTATATFVRPRTAVTFRVGSGMFLSVAFGKQYAIQNAVWDGQQEFLLCLTPMAVLPVSLLAVVAA